MLSRNHAPLSESEKRQKKTEIDSAGSPELWAQRTHAKFCIIPNPVPDQTIQCNILAADIQQCLWNNGYQLYDCCCDSYRPLLPTSLGKHRPGRTTQGKLMQAPSCQQIGSCFSRLQQHRSPAKSGARNATPVVVQQLHVFQVLVEVEISRIASFCQDCWNNYSGVLYEQSKFWKHW